MRAMVCCLYGVGSAAQEEDLGGRRVMKRRAGASASINKYTDKDTGKDTDKATGTYTDKPAHVKQMHDGG